VEEKLRLMLKAAQQAIANAQDLEEINKVKINYLGKKGELTRILRGMGALAENERRSYGRLANKIREEIEEVLEKQTNVF
jgi:phenylalanyl-tRNA synthetase alpha chain